MSAPMTSPEAPRTTGTSPKPGGRGRGAPAVAATPDEYVELRGTGRHDEAVVGAAGAYGAAMGSSYNTRPLAAEIMVRGSDAAVNRARQDVDALIASEALAPWLRG
jgi:hypothetical protein